MKKFVTIILIQTLLSLDLNASLNPLSKIVITSNRATCQKDKIIHHQYIFNYQENVLVTFADKSTITANNLEIIFEGNDLGEKKTTLADSPKINPDPNKPPKSNFLDKFKKITLSGNVNFSGQNRTATSDKAELQLATNVCTLIGNVIITQRKTTSKEVPITIESSEAKINLKTQELLLSGVENKPVNTIISLEDYEPLKKMSKGKKKN